MQKINEERPVELGEYIVGTGATVRQAAEVFGISKTTVHKDVAERLKNIDKKLFRKVRKILDKNKKERAIRGGESTRQKYLKLKGSDTTKKSNELKKERIKSSLASAKTKVNSNRAKASKADAVIDKAIKVKEFDPFINGVKKTTKNTKSTLANNRVNSKNKGKVTKKKKNKKK